ncbi:MAG: 1-(5-phosphoribosyl)-5-amino-4-imidazole-carboxylate carboxylase, partial [Clostridia bacterium]|nr:1-(5-phosphoribosyl)-5-amino-4-imidazole-carboxylate carboxylase [Clostridia bacterium]
MNKQEMLEALRHVADGSLSPEDMLARLKQAPFEDIGCANIDYHRSVRQGAGEVIYGKSKTPEQILAICENMIAHGEENILITRMSPEAARQVGEKIELFYDPVSLIGVA